MTAYFQFKDIVMPVTLLKNLFNATALLALMASAGTAFAHAHLEQSTPAADSTVASPAQLRLQFTEGVEQAFTKVVIIRDAAPVPVSSVKTEPTDKKVLIVTPAAPLAPGDYQVKWHAVSVDTHKSEGQYRFTVSQ